MHPAHRKKVAYKQVMLPVNSWSTDKESLGLLVIVAKGGGCTILVLFAWGSGKAGTMS